MSTVKPSITERDGVDLEETEEISPSSDLIETAGIAFHGSITHVMERIGGIIKNTIPDNSSVPIYTLGNLTAYEIFNGNIQTTPNRLVRGDFTFTTGNLTTEVWKIYDTADGTTILRSITIIYTYSGDDLIKILSSEV